MRKPPPGATTWTAVSLIALGLIMIFLGWNGAAGEQAADLRSQFPYLISGGVFGLALIGAGLVLVRTFEARRDTQSLAAHLERLTAAVERLEAAHPAAQAQGTPADPPGGPYAAAVPQGPAVRPWEPAR